MIKECPFCKGVAKVGEFEDTYNCSRSIKYYYIVYCLNDDCVASMFSTSLGFDSENEAIEVWNTRK